MNSKDIALIGMCIAVVSVSAQIVIPIGPVPFSLQVFALSCISFTMTRKQAIYTVILYVIMGLIGFPIFTYARGGVGVLGSPTIGFIIGFIPFVILLSTITNRLLAVFLAYITLYIFGIAMLARYYSLNTDTIVNAQLLASSWLPFIPSDFLSMFFATRISKRLKTSLNW